MENVEIDFKACKECGYCMAVCPKNLFEKGQEFNDKGFRAYRVVRPQDCVGCTKCFYACPDFAISLKKLEAIQAGGEYEKSF